MALLPIEGSDPFAEAVLWVVAPPTMVAIPATADTPGICLLADVSTVLCAEPVAEYLLQYARHLIYSTAMPPAQVCAIDASLNAIIRGDGLRQQLGRNITRFRTGAAGLGYCLPPSASAIQPLLVGDNSRAQALTESLRERGCWLTAIRPPTVPLGSARLRITITAAHQSADIDRLLEVLDDVRRPA